MTLESKLNWFCGQMKLKLDANSHKPGWEKDSLFDRAVELARKELK